MMKKYRAYFVIMCILVMMIALYSIIYFNSDFRNKKQRNISLITYGADGERWQNLKLGAEMAAKEYDAEVNMITMSSENDGEEQWAMIQREVSNGADALVVAAADSGSIETYLADTPPVIPVVFIQNGPENEESYPCIYTDPDAMGRQLAAAVIEQTGETAKIAVVCEHTEKKSVSGALLSLTKQLDEASRNYVLWERENPEQGYQTSVFVRKRLASEAVDAIVVLDSKTLVGLMDAMEGRERKIDVFAIANNDQAVYYLDEGKINTLVYQDEFSIGYLGVIEALEPLKYDQEDWEKLIRVEAITRDDMYQEDYQKLLFPFVK